MQNSLCVQVLHSPILAALLHGTPASGSVKLCGVVQGMELYTVNYKKRDILFLTITLANLNRLFLQLLYHFNREEILHVTVVKFTTSL